MLMCYSSKPGSDYMSTTLLSSLSDTSKEQLIHELKDFYIPYRDSLDLPSYATFGCEIEFNIPGYDFEYAKKIHKEGYDNAALQFMQGIYMPLIWDVVEEIEGRIEIVSDVLVDCKNCWEKLSYILSILVDNDAYYNGLGGSHAHAGMQIIGNDFEKWKLFFKLWACYEEEIIRFTNGEYYLDRKKMELYAGRSKKIIYEWLEDEKLQQKQKIPSTLCVREQNLEFLDEDCIKKYISPDIYFLNNKNATIEFRSPNLTLNRIIWQNNINLFIKLMLAVTKSNFDVELLEHRYNKEKKMILPCKTYFDEKAFELCDLIFDNDFDKKCFLRQYYKDFDDSVKSDLMIKSKPFWK